MSSETALSDAIDALPPLLCEPVATALQRFGEHADLPTDASILGSLPVVWAGSEFAARTCIRNPTTLTDLVSCGALSTPASPDHLAARLTTRLQAATDRGGLQRQLRLFREQEMLRIIWRDLAGWADLDETLADLSALAEICINQTLDWLYRELSAQHGTPRNTTGEAQCLVVLGMGKLGGRELNLSSDIDLIFAYPEAGETDGRRPLSNEQFFTRLGRQLIAALDEQTADGRVFRVDMRLRPYGSAGPLVMTFNGMENYYQDQGREWERYAMLKARVVGGDYERGNELTERLRPFVYRRYLDYGALASLREMKARVAREVRRRGLADNIKLGRGGIREVEFIGQSFQLIRGGQDQALRRRSLLPVLDHLATEGLLPAFARDELRAGYRFLRRLENRVQAINDQQTHELPASDVDRARLALTMGAADWAELETTINRWRRRIQGHFDQVFVAPQSEEEAGDEDDLGDVWRGGLDASGDVALLTEAGFTRPEATLERLHALRDSRAVRALSASGRDRLDRLMPLLIQAAAGQPEPDTTLERLLTLLEGIVRRTAYLALLNEHPMALSQLVQLAGGSPWLARLLARHPVLLDELLDPRDLYKPLRREALEAELDDRLQGVEPDDLERQMEVLRHFQQTNSLRVAAADISGALPIMVVSDYLSDIAEVVLEAVLRVAWHHVTQRYGEPRGHVDGERVTQPFVILAYGKLASLELGYGSDLDLVFLHGRQGEHQQTDGARPVENAVFFARLAQRVIHILNTPTPGGVLYEVDTRLRPSGKSGLLTTGIDAFADYQQQQAWTWEHQALVRSRIVAGDPDLAIEFGRVRDAVLARKRDAATLGADVRHMRDRMLAEKASKDPNLFDLKQDRGGIADIEFMVQYGVLAGAHNHASLLRHTDNIRLLDELSRSGLITADRARRLADAYRVYRARIHRLTLQEQPTRVPAADFAREREAVASAWRELLGEPTQTATDTHAPDEENHR